MNNIGIQNSIKVQEMKTLKTHGVSHWKLQRISAIAMIPLIIWFISSLMLTLMEGYEQSIEWLQSPINATGLILLFGTLYWHLGASLDHLGAILAHLGLSWAFFATLGASMSYLGPSWSHLEAYWDHLGIKSF